MPALPVTALAAVDCPKATQGKAISSRNAYEPNSVRRSLPAIAAEVRAAARCANKGARA